jgi:hypothetical protein
MIRLLLFANYAAAPGRFKARNRRANGRAAEVITLKVGVAHIFQYSRALSLTRARLSFAMNESDRNVRGAVCSANLRCCSGQGWQQIDSRPSKCSHAKQMALRWSAMLYVIHSSWLMQLTVVFFLFGQFQCQRFWHKRGDTPQGARGGSFIETFLFSLFNLLVVQWMLMYMLLLVLNGHLESFYLCT